MVKIPCSNEKKGLATVLLDEGYIRGFDVVEDGKQGILRVDLKYGPKGEAVIVSLKRESRGGRRLYSKCADLPEPLDGLGVAVISTSQGILSDRECRKRNIGGEILCSVY
jgi:small subunit ribosomal protein S8